MLRKLGIAVAAVVAVLATVGFGLSAVIDRLEDGLFGGGPASAVFVDRLIGTVDPRALDLAGDLLLASRHTVGLTVRPLADLTREPLTLFGGVSVHSVAPGGRYVTAWTGTRWQVVRLADLRAVAEVRGAQPFFSEADRVVAIFQGRRCRHRDAVVLDLARRTRSEVKLSGEAAGLDPVALHGGELVAQRLQPGDSGCGPAGFARVDLQTGAVTTGATAGAVSTVAQGHVWVDGGDETRVFDERGSLVSTFSARVEAEATEAGVVYAEHPYHLRGGGVPSDQPTALRLGAPSGPRPEDTAGDELREPEEIRVVQNGAAVLVAHWGADLPNGGHTTLLSRCSLPRLECRQLLDVTEDLPRIVGVVPAAVFQG